MAKGPCFVVLGSGGHTAEMCRILKLLKDSPDGLGQFQPMRFLVAKTDRTSRQKVSVSMAEVHEKVQEQDFIEVPRSREVGQSYLTTLFTTLWAMLCSFWLVWQHKPSMVLSNGPGTCLPFCVAAYCGRLCGRLASDTRIVYVESFCRVRSLSLSGRLLLPFLDVLVVQWKPLAEAYRTHKKVKYFGRIM